VSVLLGDTWFPETDWNDFPIPIVDQLTSIVQAVRLLPADGQHTFELSFLDGPWRLEIYVSGGSLAITGFDDGRSRCVTEVQCSVDEFGRVVTSASRKLDSALRKLGWR
jgi:hypothetical protein